MEDKATQKRVEELIEESKLSKSVTNDVIKECEEAKDCLRKIRDELNKKNWAISAMAERLAEDNALSTRESSLRNELNAKNEELFALKNQLSRSTDVLEFLTDGSGGGDKTGVNRGGFIFQKRAQ